jgi:hypothetical protein
MPMNKLNAGHIHSFGSLLGSSDIVLAESFANNVIFGFTCDNAWHTLILRDYWALPENDNCLLFIKLLCKSANTNYFIFHTWSGNVAHHYYHANGLNLYTECYMQVPYEASYNCLRYLGSGTMGELYLYLVGYINVGDNELVELDV